MRKIISLFSFLLLLSCGQSPQISGGVETGNGFSVGIAFSTDNQPHKAIVSLVPETFNPVTDILADSLIDTTGSDGAYLIKAPVGKYNLIARTDDSSEIALIQNCIVQEQAEVNFDITLRESSPCTLSLSELSLSDGDFYFEGTPFRAHYTLKDTIVIFIAVPVETPMPAIYRYEDGEEQLWADEVLPAERVRITDGFADYTSLIFDEKRQNFWAGTKHSGIFRYNMNGKMLKHDGPEVTERFKNGVNLIKMGIGDDPFVGTGHGLFKYSSSEVRYDLIDSGAVSNYDVKDLGFTNNGKWIAAYSNSIRTEDTVITVSGLNAMVNVNDSVYTATENGKIFLFHGEDMSRKVLPVTLPAMNDLFMRRNGQLVVATDAGLVLMDNGVETERLSSFSQADRKSVVALCEDAAGTLWILTEGSGLYRMNSDNSTSKIMGYHSLLPKTTIKTRNFNAVDLTFDHLGDLWLLIEDGAMIRISGTH